MNHSYRLAWNESSQSYVAAPECARGKGKAGKGRLKPLALVLGTCLGSWLGNPAFAAPPAANALPTGGQVVAGQASVAQSGSAMTVTQGSDKAILNWQTFDIGSQASVRFIQPSTNAVALNRVLSGEASQIYGKLGANGHVFLVNPAGVVFGAGSKIDVGGLVASTMDITNEDFLAGRLDFRRNGATGGISNHGEITAGDGGLVALLASTVKNEGVLSARLGTVALAAGDRVTLPAGANGHLQLAVEPSTVRTLVENRQMILADGGQVLMTSRAADALSAGVVANSGTIRAQTLQEHEGRILLLADMAHGEVRHGGLLDASAPNGGDGGFVETSAATVSLEGQRKVTTLAPLGKTGTWLIDPNDYTIAASGGNITGAQLSSDLALSNVTIATASQGTSGGNGDIFVNAPVTWSANTTLSLQAQRYIEINADITATGNTAGLVLGTQYDYRLGHGARITLSGAAPTLKIGNPGSEYNYTVINTLAALQAMNNNRSGRYALGSDIDATATETWNGGAGFQPIGTKGAAFSGVFAGLGHTIGKLTINAPGQSTVGLFGMIQSALLRDFGLKAATIRGGSDYYVFDEGTGPIVGWAKSSNIRNVYAIDTGTSSTASGVGGLVGLLDGSTLDNSYATGTVKALVGAGYAGLGGLVGHLSSGASIMDSYTKAQVSDESGTAYAGSLAGVGSAGTGAMSSIIRSYAFNYCSPCSGNPTSGIIGYSESPLTVFSSYYNDGWGSSQAYGTSIGNSTRASSYAGLDFVKTWRIYEDQSTPVLRAFQRDAFVTVDSAGKTYDGSAWNAPGYTASGAPVSGSVSFSGSYKNAVNAGNYSIVASGLGFTRNEAQDYQDFGDVVYVNGTLTIAPRPITVQAADLTRVFGDANPTSGSLALTAGSLVGGDTLGNASLSSSATATSAAGQSFALTPDNAAFASGSAGNYAITYQNGTLTITQRPITVQASNQTRTYGNANPASGGLVLTGGSLANGDALGNASLSSSATATSAAGQSFALTPDNAAFASGSAGNYAITYQNGTLTIAQAPLTVAANSSGKTYDGIAWNGIPGVTYSGFVNGETAAALGGTLAFGGNAQGATNAGSYTIAPSGLTSGNYAITFQDGALTIAKAPLTVAANSSGKTYDGIAWNGAPGATYSGFVNGETAAALGGALSFADSAQGAVNAGSYAIAPSGLSSGNYAITFQNGALTIAPRAITVKTGDLTRVFGDANPSSGGLILAAGSLVGGDTLGNASLSSSATATSAAGQSFALTPDNAAFASGSAGNYAITYQNGTLTIAQRPITVQASNQTRTYGSANPASGSLVLTGGSLANGDTLGNASLSSSATATSAAGQSFALTPDNAAFASGSAGNYAITYQNGTLTITQAPLTVAANNATKTYDGIAWTGGNGVSYSGFVNGETAGVLGGTLTYAGSSQDARETGSYVIAINGLTSGNYAISFRSGTLTIAPVAPAGGSPSAAPGGAQIALANPAATAQGPSAPPTQLAARNPEGGRGAMNSPYLTVSANSIRIDE